MTDARLAELVERAFDYRGYVTLRRTDGSELVGFVYDRSASHLDLYDETATRRVRVSLADVADIAFTGDDPARKAQALWERRKGTLEPRETSAWGEWRESGPVLLLVALDRELRSVARALGLVRRGGRRRHSLARDPGDRRPPPVVPPSLHPGPGRWLRRAGDEIRALGTSGRGRPRPACHPRPRRRCRAGGCAAPAPSHARGDGG